MKRCTECRRDYLDDTLSFCLEDGTPLVYVVSEDEPATAILQAADAVREAQTRPQNSTINETEVLPTKTGDVVPKPRGLDKRLLAAPFMLAIIILGGFFGYRYLTRASAEQVDSIAVLPFENRSGNADTDYLSDGLADSLIYRLSQLPKLKVSPTSSVMRYKGKETDVPLIAKELDVDAVMSGRLVQRGDDLSISVQPLARKLGDQVNTFLAFYGFAACRTNAGEFHRATVLTGAAERLRETVEFSLEPAERRLCGLYLENLHKAMSKSDFEVAYAEGRNMAVVDAVEIALG